MYQSLKRVFVISVVLCTLLIVTVSGSAFASAGNTTTATTTKVCAVLEVHLHGKEKQTSTCLRQEEVKVVNGKIQPTVISKPSMNDVVCYDGTLAIYSSPNFDLWAGYVICYDGFGTANLSDNCIWICAWGTWNDQMSGYVSGGACVTFYWDANEHGEQLYAPKNVSVGYVGDHWNHQASSFDRYSC